MLFNQRPPKNTAAGIPAIVSSSPATAKVQESTGKINELLRHADGLLKQGDAESALILIREARSLAPSHSYTEAMEERIHRWIEEHRQHRTGAPSTTATLAVPSGPPTASPASELPAVLEPPPRGSNSSGATDRAVVLLIDDDDPLRTALQETVDRGGYEAIGVATAEEAVILLQRLTPDAIVCDVNLETSSFGGFTLFERIQAVEHLRRVPFIFLTGLHDDVLLRTGKELGADDYLRKPITTQDLLSVLRGKIRRYRRLSAGPTGPRPIISLDPSSKGRS